MTYRDLEPSREWEEEDESIRREGCIEEIEGRLIRSRSHSLLDCGGDDTDGDGVMRKVEFGVDREEDGNEL
jgi:hypothetical protein